MAITKATSSRRNAPPILPCVRARLQSCRNPRKVRGFSPCGAAGFAQLARFVLPPPPGLTRFFVAFPRLAPWAIIFRPSGCFVALRGSRLRTGSHSQGLKPAVLWSESARLKSCPDTNRSTPTCGDSLQVDDYLSPFRLACSRSFAASNSAVLCAASASSAPRRLGIFNSCCCFYPLTLFSIRSKILQRASGRGKGLVCVPGIDIPGAA